jgi:hypothetical protein
VAQASPAPSLLHGASGDWGCSSLPRRIAPNFCQSSRVGQHGLPGVQRQRGAGSSSAAGRLAAQPTARSAATRNRLTPPEQEVPRIAALCHACQRRRCRGKTVRHLSAQDLRAWHLAPAQLASGNKPKPEPRLPRAHADLRLHATAQSPRRDSARLDRRRRGSVRGLVSATRLAEARSPPVLSAAALAGDPGQRRKPDSAGMPWHALSGRHLAASRARVPA